MNNITNTNQKKKFFDFSLISVSLLNNQTHTESPTPSNQPPKYTKPTKQQHHHHHHHLWNTIETPNQTPKPTIEHQIEISYPNPAKFEPIEQITAKIPITCNQLRIPTTTATSTTTSPATNSAQAPTNLTQPIQRKPQLIQPNRFNLSPNMISTAPPLSTPTSTRTETQMTEKEETKLKPKPDLHRDPYSKLISTVTQNWSPTASKTHVLTPTHLIPHSDAFAFYISKSHSYLKPWRNKKNQFRMATITWASSTKVHDYEFLLLLPLLFLFVHKPEWLKLTNPSRNRGFSFRTYFLDIFNFWELR